MSSPNRALRLHFGEDKLREIQKCFLDLMRLETSPEERIKLVTLEGGPYRECTRFQPLECGRMQLLGSK